MLSCTCWGVMIKNMVAWCMMIRGIDHGICLSAKQFLSLLVGDEILSMYRNPVVCNVKFWMITLVTYLTPYQTFSDNLYTELSKLNRVKMLLIVHFKWLYEKTSVFVYKGLDTEMINSRATQSERLSTFQELAYR